LPAINLPPEYIERLKSITAKRPKTVIEHILKRGFITTEELKNLYGYNHAPRAAMDVKDQGIPLEMFKVANEQGRMIAAYRFCRSIRRALWAFWRTQSLLKGVQAASD
jgi:hypothetical protein